MGENCVDEGSVPLMILIHFRLEDLNTGRRAGNQGPAEQNRPAVRPQPGGQQDRRAERPDRRPPFSGLSVKPGLGQGRAEEDDDEAKQMRTAPGQGLEQGEIGALRVGEEVRGEARRPTLRGRGDDGPTRPTAGDAGARGPRAGGRGWRSKPSSRRGTRRGRTRRGRRREQACGRTDRSGNQWRTTAW